MSFLTDKLQKVVNLGKHGYPLDERHLFTAKAGQLLPIMAKPMLPGDTFDIDVIQTTQTAPFNKAAFFRCKKYYHFWFVPYSFLWSQWDSYISQRTNPRSANSKGSRFVPCMSLRSIFMMVKSAYEYSQNPPVQDLKRDDIGNFPYQGFLRMLDLMGYGNWTMEEITKVLTAYDQGDENIVALCNKKVNLFVPAAYQYIYNYVYRNKYFDDGIDAHFFNFDDIVCSSVEDCDITNPANLVNYGAIGSEWRWWNLFMMRYRQWNHDMFTGVLPSSQYGEVSTVSSLNTRIINSKTGVIPANGSVGFGGTNNPYLIATNANNQLISGTDKWSLPNLFDVLQLRKAEAMQKWKETTMRNGRDARSQALGHYGVAPSHSVDYQPIFVGGFDDRIICDPVTATSNTQGVDSEGEQNIGSVLGQLAGRGVSTNDIGHIKFNSSEFGVLMCMFSIVPDADYNAEMLDKQHTLLEPFDFWTPELENLGFEPVTQSELSIKPLLEGFGEVGHIVSVSGYNPNNVLGYLPRYHMYKTSIDKLHGEFCTGRSLEAMSVPRSDLIKSLYRIIGDPFRPDSATYLGMNKSSFYINPNILNNVFNISADDTQATDQFYNLVRFKNRSARPLSVLGLPY